MEFLSKCRGSVSSSLRILQPLVIILIISTDSRLFPRYSVRHHYMCPHCTSGHLPQRILLGHCRVRSLSNRFIRAPDPEYQIPHHHGLLRWVVCVDPGLYLPATSGTPTYTAEPSRCLLCGRTPSFTWSWGGWSTISRPRLSSSASRLGDSHSISYSSTSCEYCATHRIDLADTRIRAFVIQVSGASMASGDHVPEQTVLRGLQ